MASKKKLQVFISSTFTDLQEERQAAVSAILTAGHIPAGMELFTAGDESQMQVIKRWIDESDVYLLILGSRYGSVEPISGKSYTHLEYEYAIEIGKPFFAVAIKDSAEDERMKRGKEFIELKNHALLREFREMVTSRMVRFWEDSRDIKIAILETISEFSRRDDLIGWVQGDEQVNGGALAEEIVRLNRENTSLKQEVDELKLEKELMLIEREKLNGFTYSELEVKLDYVINNKVFENMNEVQFILKIASIFNDSEPKLLHFFWYKSQDIMSNHNLYNNSSSIVILVLRPLVQFGLLREIKNTQTSERYYLTEAGKYFLLLMRDRYKIDEAEIMYADFI